MRYTAALLLCVLGAPGAVSASTGVATNVQRPALKVDARGNAEVSWTAGGVRRTLLIPPQGRVLPGGKISGRDVSRAASSPQLPFLKVLRRTPDGRFWALQEWPQQAGGPRELRFSRWRGAATTITLVAEPDGQHLAGVATFQGRPVTGTSPTPAGRRVRHYAYVDCFACAGAGGWKRLLGVATRSDGSFRLFLRPEWQTKRYRVAIAGPNRGTTYAPDALAVTTLVLPQ